MTTGKKITRFNLNSLLKMQNLFLKTILLVTSDRDPESYLGCTVIRENPNNVMLSFLFPHRYMKMLVRQLLGPLMQIKTDSAYG